MAYRSGNSLPSDGVLVVPATVTSIGRVSERASLLHCAASRNWRVPCLLVPSGRPLPLLHMYARWSTEERQTKPMRRALRSMVD